MENIVWIVQPNESVNGILFGTDRASIKKMLGKPKRIFRESSDSVNTIDEYPAFHAYYSVDNKLEALEFFEHEICISIDSKIIFPGKLSIAKEKLQDLQECCGSYISASNSVGISADGDEIISILIGCKDYYRQMLETINIDNKRTIDDNNQFAGGIK